MNPYSIPPAICSIFALALGIFALRYNYKSSAARIFFGQCCTIIVWQSFYWIIYNFGDHNSLIYSYAKFSYCGISFIPSVFYQCICELLEITKYKKWYLYNYLFSIISSFFILKSNYIINGLCRYPWGLYIKAGPAHPVYLFFFIGICLLGLSIIILSFKENKDSPKKLNRSKYVAAAFCIFSLSNFDFLPAYGINLYPIGYLYTAIFLCIIAYATIKYQLLDINIAIKKSIIYSLLVTFLTFIYIVLIIVFERLSQSLFGYKDILGSFFAAVVIAAAFIPFRNKLQKLIDAIFLKGSPIKISEENELLRKEVTQTDKLKAIATLASGIAHEIRNPITAIKTFSEYLPQKANDQEFLRNYSRTVNKEIDRIDNLIKDLLDFAKPSSPLLQETEIHDLLGTPLTLFKGSYKRMILLSRKTFTVPKFDYRSTPIRSNRPY